MLYIVLKPLGSWLNNSWLSCDVMGGDKPHLTLVVRGATNKQIRLRETDPDIAGETHIRFFKYQNILARGRA